jgi:hypothetical protein
MQASRRYIWFVSLAEIAIALALVWHYFWRLPPTAVLDPPAFLLVIALIGLSMPASAVYLLRAEASRRGAAAMMFVALMASSIALFLVLFAAGYRTFGLVDGERTVYDAATCFYFSIVTWTTVGYGDVRPTPDSRFIAAAEAFFGYIWMAMAIGLFASFLRMRFGIDDRASMMKTEKGVCQKHGCARGHPFEGYVGQRRRPYSSNLSPIAFSDLHSTSPPKIFVSEWSDRIII